MELFLRIQIGKDDLFFVSKTLIVFSNSFSFVREVNKVLLERNSLGSQLLSDSF